MQPLKNVKQELFAQAISRGESQLQAYVNAGYSPSDSAASRLYGNVKVAKRVKQLQQMAIKKTIVTIESLSDELEEARALALKVEAPAAAVSASMGKAKLHGLDINKHEHSGDIYVTISSDDDKL
jgi:phage terminase small subunit